MTKKLTMIQRHRLRCYRYLLRKDENDWVKKCMDSEVECVRPRGSQRKLGSEVMEQDCQTRQICKEEDAMHRRKWRRLIKDVV